MRTTPLYYFVAVVPPQLHGRGFGFVNFACTGVVASSALHARPVRVCIKLYQATQNLLMFSQQAWRGLPVLYCFRRGCRAV